MSNVSPYSMTLAGQFRRLLSILKLIDKSPGEWDAAGLAVKLDVSEPTIHRDIRLLRRLGKIRKVRGAGYVLEELCFAPSRLEPREALALALATQGLQTDPPAPLARAAASALRKVCAVQPERVKAALGSLEQHLVLAPRAGRGASAPTELLDTLAEAVLRHTPVRFSYAADYSGERTTRRVDPYALHFGGAAWYLTGYCHLRKDLRTFHLARIRDLRLLKEQSFSHPEDFDLAKHLGRGWNVWVEEGEQVQVRLRFKPEAAEYLEQTRWHPRQKTTRNADGSVDFGVELAGVTEIASWVLSFGSLVEVLEPDELRERVKREAEALVRQYRRKTAERAGSGPPA